MNNNEEILGTFHDTITLSSGKVMHVEVTLVKGDKTYREIFQPYLSELVREINSGQSMTRIEYLKSEKEGLYL